MSASGFVWLVGKISSSWCQILRALAGFVWGAVIDQRSQQLRSEIQHPTWLEPQAASRRWLGFPGRLGPGGLALPEGGGRPKDFSKALPSLIQTLLCHSITRTSWWVPWELGRCACCWTEFSLLTKRLRYKQGAVTFTVLWIFTNVHSYKLHQNHNIEQGHSLRRFHPLFSPGGPGQHWSFLCFRDVALSRMLSKWTLVPCKKSYDKLR